MSEFETTGLSITLFKPTITLNTAVTPYTATWVPEGSYIGSFAQEVTAYQHSIQAMGGYENATFSLVMTLADMEWWIQSGLGVHVRVANAGNTVVWEGFVNELAISLGHVTMAVGPLTGIGNQVTAIYTLEDTSTTPPTTGVRMRTAAFDWAPSETKYGIFQKVLAVGGATTAEANYIAGTWLSERAFPDTTKNVSLGAGAGEILITFKCVGYAAMLVQPYNQMVTTGTINLSAKLSAILTAMPNALFSVANSSIAANTLQCDAYEDDDVEGMSIIKDLVSHGDAAALKYNFGVYEGRRAVYAVVDWNVAYHTRLFDMLQSVTDVNGNPVQPWDVLPGKWLMLTDFLAGMDMGLTVPPALWADPRALYIESVTYTSPYALQISGGKVDRISQRLAALGLGGA